MMTQQLFSAEIRRENSENIAELPFEQSMLWQLLTFNAI
jgi:hypothetical protein